MSYGGTTWILDVLGWLLFTVIPIAGAVLAVLAWRRPARILTILTGAVTALALLIAALLPGPAPTVVTVLTAASALVGRADAQAEETRMAFGVHVERAVVAGYSEGPTHGAEVRP